MEETNQTGSSRTKVGFPDANETKKSGNGKVVLLVVIILLILGGATWYLFSRREETIEFTNDAITSVPVEQTPTPGKVMIDKSTLKIQVLNGTGTPGDAGKLEKAVNDLGYSEVVTGNAENYDYKIAEVTFSSDFPENYRDEIIQVLNGLYSEVKVGNESLGEFDAILITAIAKGAKTTTTTPKPTSSVTPTVRVTATLTPTP